MSDHATKNEVEDVRLDFGVMLARVREEWREELKLGLRSFKNEMRVTIAVAVLILKFDVPKEVTAAAIGGLALKGGLGFFRLH